MGALQYYKDFITVAFLQNITSAKIIMDVNIYS